MRLSQYEVVARLRNGGMEDVYRARDIRLNRVVALAVLPEHLAQDAETLARVVRKAKALAALSHPNIQAIYDVRVDEGVPYVVMENVEGRTLREVMTGAMTPMLAFRYATQIASALVVIHKAGLVHGDLKPESILVEAEGRIRIIDFGLSRSWNRPVGVVDQKPTADVQTASADSVVGSVDYASPEQLEGKRLDARADIYTLGVILCEMLIATTPFGGREPSEFLTEIFEEGSVALPPNVQSQEFADLVRRTLANDREDRFRSAEELLTELKDVMEEVKHRGEPGLSMAYLQCLSVEAMERGVFTRGRAKGSAGERISFGLLGIGRVVPRIRVEGEDPRYVTTTLLIAAILVGAAIVNIVLGSLPLNTSLRSVAALVGGGTSLLLLGEAFRTPRGTMVQAALAATAVILLYEVVLLFDTA